MIFGMFSKFVLFSHFPTPCSLPPSTPPPSRRSISLLCSLFSILVIQHLHTCTIEKRTFPANILPSDIFHVQNIFRWKNKLHYDIQHTHTRKYHPKYMEENEERRTFSSLARWYCRYSMPYGCNSVWVSDCDISIVPSHSFNVSNVL